MCRVGKSHNEEGLSQDRCDSCATFHRDDFLLS